MTYEQNEIFNNDINIKQQDPVDSSLHILNGIKSAKRETNGTHNITRNQIGQS
jgi:hypothetical protein